MFSSGWRQKSMLWKFAILSVLVDFASSGPTRHNESSRNQTSSRPPLREVWNLFMRKYNKKYGHDEIVYRWLIFKNSVETITEHNFRYNLGLVSFPMGLTFFSDWSDDEFDSAHSLELDVPANIPKLTPREVWERYKKMYNKEYNPVEDAIRWETFKEKMADIAVHNLRHDLDLVPYPKGLTQFTDMSEREFIDRFSLKLNKSELQRLKSSCEHELTGSPVPESFDWRKRGFATAVKNQMNCGSCYSFASAAALEFVYFKEKGHLMDLAPQQILDCSGNEPYKNGGCQGGFLEKSFQYVRDHGGICTWNDYPFVDCSGYCREDKCEKAITISGFKSVGVGDELALRDAIANVGPVAVYIAATTHFKDWRGEGIFEDSDCSGHRVDHSVLLVGFGTENGRDYWIIKNSWGETFGLDGYAKISRNYNHQCGITSNPVYPYN